MVGRGLRTRVVEGVVEISCALNQALMGEWIVTSNTDSLALEYRWCSLPSQNAVGVP